MTEQELEKLLNQAQSGDHKAFGEIFDQYAGRIYKFIYYRTSHKEVSEDILSDTFVKAWSKIGQINSPKALTSWLYQVAKNNVIDYYRVRKETVALEEVAEFLEDPENIIDHANLSVEQAKIMALLDSLPQEQSEVIKYRFYEDLTTAEIAHLLNKPEGTIRVIQHRAITNLKQLLDKQLKRRSNAANSKKPNT